MFRPRRDIHARRGWWTCRRRMLLAEQDRLRRRRHGRGRQEIVEQLHGLRLPGDRADVERCCRRQPRTRPASSCHIRHPARMTITVRRARHGTRHVPPLTGASTKAIPAAAKHRSRLQPRPRDRSSKNPRSVVTRRVSAAKRTSPHRRHARTLPIRQAQENRVRAARPAPRAMLSPTEQRLWRRSVQRYPAANRRPVSGQARTRPGWRTSVAPILPRPVKPKSVLQPWYSSRSLGWPSASHVRTGV